MVNKMELNFSADLINEPFARTAVVSFVSFMNPTMDEIVELKTIVSEAVANAIIHGCQYNPKMKVYVEAWYNKDREISIIIQDFGVGIEDVELARQPLYTTKKEEERAGMGFTIMESYSDGLQVQSILGLGTKLIIRKQLEQAHA